MVRLLSENVTPENRPNNTRKKDPYLSGWKKVLGRWISRCKGPEIKMSGAGLKPLTDRVEGGKVTDRDWMFLFHLVSLLLCSYCLPHQQFATSWQRCLTFTSGPPLPPGSIKASSENAGHFCWAPCGRAQEVCEWAGPRGLRGCEETAGNYIQLVGLTFHGAGLSHPEGLPCPSHSHLSLFSLVNVYKVCIFRNLQESAIPRFLVGIPEWESCVLVVTLPLPSTGVLDWTQPLCFCQ